MVIEKEKVDEETLIKWEQDSSYWKMGIFYFNPVDKRIFPPKRNKGAGWTINFANPYSIIIFIAAMTLIIGFAMFINR